MSLRVKTSRRWWLWLMPLLTGIAACNAETSGALVPAHVQAPDTTVQPADRFFGLDRLHTFELVIAADDIERMMPSSDGGFRFGDTEYPKVPAVLRFEGREWGKLLVRYKGNSSFMRAPTPLKRSLKLDFDAPDAKRRFFGMRTLNLNNNAFDPSQMRETLAYDVFHRADVPAPRTAFAKVYLTVPGHLEREYAGLFTAVEQIDQTFFADRWGQKVGLLLKPEDVQGMPDLGRDWGRYATAYSSKVNAKERDAARFMAFVRFVNSASDEDLVEHLHEYLDVDGFLRFLAVEVAIVNTDSPLAMNHNYWVTIHPKTGKVIWLPWDMNESFGGFRFGDVDLNLYAPSIPGLFPLAERLLGIPTFVRRYEEALRIILRTNLTAARLDAEIARLAALIRPAVAADPSLKMEDFERSTASNAASNVGITDGWPMGFGHSGPPLRQFIHARIASVIAQLEGAGGETRTRAP